MHKCYCIRQQGVITRCINSKPSKHKPTFQDKHLQEHVFKFYMKETLDALFKNKTYTCLRNVSTTLPGNVMIDTCGNFKGSDFIHAIILTFC